MSEKDTEMTTVRVQFDIPAFIGSDMRKYGPFKAGDVAVISKANADFLMSKGVVSTRVEETPKAKEEENRWALPDHSYKQRPCDRTAKPVEDNPGDLKRQFEETVRRVNSTSW